MRKKNPIGFLNSNMLKIIAIVLMTFDHFAVLFYPHLMWMRIPGRLAFPIFAFLIAEGFRHTRNRLRYFLILGGLGTAFQLVYGLVMKDDTLNIFITLAIGVALCALLELVKVQLLSPDAVLWKKICLPLLLVCTLAVVWLIDDAVTFDYGFFGCLLPMLASFPHTPRGMDVPWLKGVDILPVQILCFLCGLIPLNHTFHPVQHYALLAIPLLLMYSGERGKLKMKYFFYIYYPAHLVALEGLYLLIKG